MLEITIIRDNGGARTPFAFQFENDALQAFFDSVTADDALQLVSLRSMTSPLVLTGETPKAKTKAQAAEAQPSKPSAPEKK